MKDFKVGIAQFSPTCGDPFGNLERLKILLKETPAEVDLVIFSFLPLTGYPLLSLSNRRDFLRDCTMAFEELVKFSQEVKVPLLFTHVEGESFPSIGMYLLRAGEVIKRVSSPFNQLDNLYLSLNLESLRILIFVEGHDLSFPAHEGDVFVILSKRPYYFGEESDFFFRLKDLAIKKRAFVFYVRGAYLNDEYIFPGKSLGFTPKGELFLRAKAFEEELKIGGFSLDESKESLAKEEFSELFQALVFALRSYIEKTGFPSAILGLSGGIDSALVATIAVYALGKDKVKALFMPSLFTSQESREDAYALAQNLGISLREISIQEVFDVYKKNLSSVLSLSEGITVADENLQARIRANLLFYFSNRENHLVLCTSNKSESATGYGTIYGDIAGGYAPIKDVYKTWVYELARYQNSLRPVIPERVFTKAPSAELRPGQRDEDVLPPYPLLDAILRAHLEEGLTPEEIVNRGFPKEYVEKTFKMLARAEYKRRQSPLGPKVTKSALGVDYILPLMLRW